MSMQECSMVYKNKWSLLFHGDQDSSYFVKKASGKTPADKDEYGTYGIVLIMVEIIFFFTVK